MRRARTFAALLLIAPQAAAPSDRLETARVAFESPRNDERLAAARTLLRELAPADVDAALAAIGSWPPTAALLLRQTLASSGRARAALLERATRGDAGEATAGVARSLIIESFIARAAASAPFRTEARPGADSGFALAERGAWFVQPPGAAPRGWSWFELDDALARDGMLERPLVPSGDCADRLVAAPIAARVPVEGWLGVAAERASLRCVPLAVGAWLLSKERAEKLAPEQEGRGDRALALALEREARLLDAELAGLSRLADLRRGASAADLLLRLGLRLGDDPVAGGSPRERDFAAGVALARAARGDAPPPELDAAAADDVVVAALIRCARNRSDVAPAAPVRFESPKTPLPPIDAAARMLLAGQERQRSDPAALADRPAAEVRAIVARVVEFARERPATPDLRDALAAIVGAIAGRCADDPLLGGQLVELLRQAASVSATSDEARSLLEAGARELWALDRGTRPPSRLVLLPPGAPR
jgi:hypothetical protein